jgi:hypothetical protein
MHRFTSERPCNHERWPVSEACKAEALLTSKGVGPSVPTSGARRPTRL